MKLKGPGMTPKRARIVKALSLCAIFTLLSGIAFSVWYSLTSRYSTVLNVDDIEMIQLEAPKSGDPAAVIHTSAGDMTYRLYPEYCPNAVANFTELANSGYYDGTYIFRVEKGIFFAAGAPNEDGSLRDEAAGAADCEHVVQELSPKLWPLRGALCALATGQDTGFWANFTGKQKTYNGSRFLVADTVEMTDEMIEGLRSNNQMAPVAEAFIEHGGIPNYSQQITVFGQLTDGFEILDAITGAELTGESGNTRPKEPILINSVEITVYP